MCRIFLPLPPDFGSDETIQHHDSCAPRSGVGGARSGHTGIGDMRTRTWSPRSGVIVLALVVLPARLLATTANDLCAASADPCTVSSDVTVDTGSMLDLGARELHVAS